MNEEEAKAQAKELYEAGEIEVNGRIYKLLKMRHEKRLEVFAFYSNVGKSVASGDFSSFVSPQFKHVQKVMFESITFDGVQLSKMKDHWEEYPEDFLQVVGTSMGVMSYPFIRGAGTNSQSHAGKPRKTTSKKPM